MHGTDLGTARPQDMQHRRTQGSAAMEDYHPVPGGLTIRQVDGGGGNGIIWCRDAHDTTACLDHIKRRLVIRRWLSCADEGDGPLSSRSRTTGHNSETMPVRDQPPPKRLAHPTSTDKRNVIAGSDRFHTVSPGRKPTPKHHIVHGRRARGKPISRWPGLCSFSM